MKTHYTKTLSFAVILLAVLTSINCSANASYFGSKEGEVTPYPDGVTSPIFSIAAETDVVKEQNEPFNFRIYVGCIQPEYLDSTNLSYCILLNTKTVDMYILRLLDDINSPKYVCSVDANFKTRFSSYIEVAIPAERVGGHKITIAIAIFDKTRQTMIYCPSSITFGFYTNSQGKIEFSYFKFSTGPQ